MPWLQVHSGAGERRALLLSLLALAVPVAGVFLFPESLSEYEALLWLIALVPAFLLAYHRGWRGVATALAFGMAALAVSYALARAGGATIPPTLLAVVVAYIAISLGVGWLAEGVAARRVADARAAMSLQDPLSARPSSTRRCSTARSPKSCAPPRARRARRWRKARLATAASCSRSSRSSSQPIRKAAGPS